VSGKSNDVILDFAWLCGFLNHKSFCDYHVWRYVERLKIVIMAVCVGCRLTHVGRHVENSLRISNMASRGKTHTFGRHVD
jgi:hypothetical protein